MPVCFTRWFSSYSFVSRGRSDERRDSGLRERAGLVEKVDDRGGTSELREGYAGLQETSCGQENGMRGAQIMMGGRRREEGAEMKNG